MLQKGSYQIIDKPSDVTLKFIDQKTKKYIQNRNNFLTYHPKKYALSELTQLYSSTGIHIIESLTKTKKKKTSKKTK